MHICKKCNYKNQKEELLFCLNCGEILKDEYQDKEFLAENSQKIQNFLSKVEKVSQNSKITAPIKELSKDYEHILEIQNFLKLYEKEFGDEKAISNFIKNTRQFLQRDNSFQIAFAGTIKAGKSTLINAMLKKDYASMNVSPETAVLTKFKYGKEAKMTISFYNANEWEELWQSATKSGSLFKENYEKLQADTQKDKWVNKANIQEDLSKEGLKKYTSSQSAVHYFVKEVEIEFPEFPYEKNIVFVDTPGLDDAVDYRSKVTRDYINRANAVLVCVNSKALTNSELTTILRIFDHTGGKPEKVYVLGTQYDLLNKPLNDWNIQKAEWSKYLSSKDNNEQIRYTPQLAEKNIIPVSGYVALLCELYKQNSLNDEQRENLENTSFKLFRATELDNKLDDLKKFTNVDFIHQKIKDDILDSTQKEIIDDTKKEYKRIHKEIENYFKESAKSLEESYEISKSDIDSLNAKMQKEKENLAKLQESQNELENLINEFESESKKMLKELEDEIEKIIEENKR
ncbi:dynamin family protein [Helicobacter sp. CaF467b]|uniref:dynamin family protein n=1 Tax=unclassified Helicobacter TaxID=2593540 RepID=UPI001F56E989|nr:MULTISPECIES: dynamin family protein [unclassified Helicobacter]MCI2235620.1 dynamin family protein [Helicobacter sp. CaF467b]MDY5616624.1 dynamin family protein [Helicobacter sp.]